MTWLQLLQRMVATSKSIPCIQCPSCILGVLLYLRWSWYGSLDLPVPTMYWPRTLSNPPIKTASCESTIHGETRSTKRQYEVTSIHDGWQDENQPGDKAPYERLSWLGLVFWCACERLYGQVGRPTHCEWHQSLAWALGKAAHTLSLPFPEPSPLVSLSPSIFFFHYYRWNVTICFLLLQL